MQACQKANDRLEVKTEKEAFFIKDGYSLVRIDLDNLLYIEADGNYVTFFEKNKKTTVRHTLNELLNKLPKNAFLKINKSCVVALNKVDKVDNQYVVVNSTSLFLAKSYRDVLLQSLM